MLSLPAGLLGLLLAAVSPGNIEKGSLAQFSYLKNTDIRRQRIHRQLIESEQRRRDELKDAYRKLKDVLPTSSQKSNILNRGEYNFSVIPALFVDRYPLQPPPTSRVLR
jgi:hypothetical protein